MDHYNIRISEQQRRVLYKAMEYFVREDEAQELDEYGQPVAIDLYTMLSNGPGNPLHTDGINCFVL